MLKANENERILIDRLDTFKKEAIQTLNDVKTGVEMAINFFDVKYPENRTPRICTIIEDLYNKIAKFQIGSEKDSSNDGSENIWVYLNDSINYKDDIVTEKTLSFALMSFEKEVYALLTSLEQTQKSEYIFFCYLLKSKLHKIIEAYMIAQ